MLPLPYDMWMVRNDDRETGLPGHSSLEGWRRELLVDEGKSVQGRKTAISEPGRVAITGALGRSILDFNIRELRGWSWNLWMPRLFGYSRSPGYAIYWDMQCRVRASCFFVLRAHCQALHAPIIHILCALQAAVMTENTTTMYFICE